MRPGQVKTHAVSVADTATWWMDAAACRYEGQPDWFFPEPSRKGVPASMTSIRRKAAKAVCGRCPVMWDCLDYALSMEGLIGHLGRHGIWGGATPTERERIAKRREQERGASCLTP